MMTVVIFAGGAVAMTALLVLFFRAVAAPIKEGETVYGAISRSADMFARQLRPYGDDSEDPDYDAPPTTTPRGSHATTHNSPSEEEDEEPQNEDEDEEAEEDEPRQQPVASAPQSDSASIAERIRQRRRSRGRGIKILTRTARTRGKSDDN
jgi:hypothetical protein